MKTNIIIRIPEPCHEDWNKMTPDDKGRFCKSCSKTVHDFTNKSDEEIKDILLGQQNEKICGHFRKSQLDRPLNIRIDLNNLPENMSLTRKFIIAAFIVFGSFLFSCYDNSGKKVEKVVVTETKIPESVIPPSIMGQAIMPYVPPVVKENCVVTGDMIVYDPGTVEGKFEFEAVAGPDPVYATSGGAPVVILQVDSVPEPLDSTHIEKTRGEILMVTDSTLKKNEKPLTISGTKNSIEKNIQKEVSESGNTFEIFPNPSSGEFTVKYDLSKRSDVLLEIYDEQGKILKTLVNQSAQYEGKYRIPANIKDLPNGIYIVSLVADGKKTVKKIVLEK